MDWGDVGNIGQDIGENLAVPGLGVASALSQYGSNIPIVGNVINSLMGKNDSGYGAYNQMLGPILNKIENNWDVPDAETLTPQEFQILSQYSPQIAGFVQQQQPNLVPTNAVNKGTQAQQQSLDELGQLSKTGTDTGLNAQLQEAAMSADQRLRSNKANALAALNSRGLGSSGATLAADIDAGLGAGEQQRQMDLAATAQAAQRKAQAIQGLGNLGTQVAGQQQQAGEFNANTLNQYNQLMANRRQQYNDYVAGTQNQANLYNQQQNQNISNANTQLKNQYNMYNNEQRYRQAGLQNQKLMTEAGVMGQQALAGLAGNQASTQNQTNTFLGLLGIGAGLFTGGAPGALMASNSAGRIANQGAVNPGNTFSSGETGGGYVGDYDPDMGGGSTGSAIA